MAIAALARPVGQPTVRSSSRPDSTLGLETFEPDDADLTDQLDPDDALDHRGQPYDIADWVLADPFRAHLRHLMAASGLPWRALARLAGVAPHEVQALLQGGRDGGPVRKIRLPLARRLYALTPDGVTAARRATVRIDQSAAAVSALLSAGWTASELSSRLQLSARLLSAIAEGRRPVCSRVVEAKILAATQALGEFVPARMASAPVEFELEQAA